MKENTTPESSSHVCDGGGASPTTTGVLPSAPRHPEGLQHHSLIPAPKSLVTSPLKNNKNRSTTEGISTMIQQHLEHWLTSGMCVRSTTRI